MMKLSRPQTLRSLDEIPPFASEDEEREWWATHDLSEELYDQLKVSPSDPTVTLLKSIKQARRAAS
jgi:DnaJ-domain-containing protein 1